MVFFGKLKDSNEYGFSINTERFESYVEITDEEHLTLIEKANSENKTFNADKDGSPVLVERPKPSQEELAKQKTFELENYLRNTDWYVIRFVEEGVAIPEEIKTARHNAREEMSKLKGGTK